MTRLVTNFNPEEERPFVRAISRTIATVPRNAVNTEVHRHLQDQYFDLRTGPIRAKTTSATLGNPPNEG